MDENKRNPTWTMIGATYIVDVRWFEDIKCRKPLYNTIGYIEFLILDDNDEIIDTVLLYEGNRLDSQYLFYVNKETYEKIKHYREVKTLIK